MGKWIHWLERSNPNSHRGSVINSTNPGIALKAESTLNALESNNKEAETSREDGMNQCQQVYEVKLSSGSKYILAPNPEGAAWAGYQLSFELNDNLLDVKPRDGQEKLLPQ